MAASAPPEPEGVTASLPPVSIVVATHNRQASLDMLARALLQLEYPAELIEVIIVDDGSNPPAHLPFSDPRFHLLRQDQKGPASARNAGIRAATGEFVAITDDDCRPRPDWIARLCNAYRVSPNALIGGRTENALTNNIYATASQVLIDYLYHSLERASSVNQFFTTSNSGGARSRFLAIGGFDETFPLPAAEDRDLCDRWKTSAALIHVPEAVVDHFHCMSLKSYLRQHFRYGRGAHVLHRRRAARSVPFSVEGSGFYSGLFAFPFRTKPFPSASVTALLFLLAQFSNIAGYAYESCRGIQP